MDACREVHFWEAERVTLSQGHLWTWTCWTSKVTVSSWGRERPTDTQRRQGWRPSPGDDISITRRGQRAGEGILSDNRHTDLQVLPSPRRPSGRTGSEDTLNYVAAILSASSEHSLVIRLCPSQLLQAFSKIQQQQKPAKSSFCSDNASLHVKCWAQLGPLMPWSLR